MLLNAMLFSHICQMTNRGLEQDGEAQKKIMSSCAFHFETNGNHTGKIFSPKMLLKIL